MSAPQLEETDRTDIEYELNINLDGSCFLTCGGEVMWTSTADDEYLEGHGENIDADDDDLIDDTLDYLEDRGYLPPRMDVGIVREQDGI